MGPPRGRRFGPSACALRVGSSLGASLGLARRRCLRAACFALSGPPSGPSSRPPRRPSPPRFAFGLRASGGSVPRPVRLGCLGLALVGLPVVALPSSAASASCPRWGRRAGLAAPAPSSALRASAFGLAGPSSRVGAIGGASAAFLTRPRPRVFGVWASPFGGVFGARFAPSAAPFGGAFGARFDPALRPPGACKPLSYPNAKKIPRGDDPREGLNKTAYYFVQSSMWFERLLPF